MGKRGEGWVVVQGLLFALVLFAPRLRTDPFPAWVRVAGLAALLGGGALCVASFLALGKNLSAFPKPVEGGELVTTGVYGVVRHPIYAGLIIGTLGWALVTDTPVGVALTGVLFVFFDLKSRREEAWLLQAYPGYAEYRRRVCRLIPWLY